MSFHRWLLVALSFALAVGVSLWVVVSSWPHGGGALSLPARAQFAALALTGVEVLARAVKLQWCARALHFTLPFRPAMRTVLGGDFGAAITPSRSGSEPARFLILSEARVGTTNTLLLLFTELALEAASLAVVAVGLVLIFPHAGRALAGMVGVVGGYAVFVLITIAVGTLLARRRAHGPPPRWASAIGLHAGRWRGVQRVMRQLRDGMRAARTADRRWAAGALVVSCVHVVARISVLPALVLAANPSVPVAPLVLWPLTLSYGAGVTPAPGGGGLIEVGYRAALGGVIPASLLGASLIWWRFYTFYLPMLLGALVAGRAVLRAVRDRPAHGRRHQLQAELQPVAGRNYNNNRDTNRRG
jgi:uncharacterized protein (TIRG00374 family)